MLKLILNIAWEGVAWSILDSSGLGPEETKMVMSSGVEGNFLDLCGYRMLYC
jgi:hypothetical protein